MGGEISLGIIDGEDPTHRMEVVRVRRDDGSDVVELRLQTNSGAGGWLTSKRIDLNLEQVSALRALLGIFEGSQRTKQHLRGAPAEAAPAAVVQLDVFRSLAS